MNILIVYPYPTLKGLVHNFSDKLKEKGIETDSICIGGFNFEKNTIIKWPVFLRFMLWLRNNSNCALIKKIAMVILNWYFLNIYSPKKYDLVDFHAYTTSYHKLMGKCLLNDIRFDITLWGSDLMRANQAKVDAMKFGFDKCRFIKLTDNLYEDLKCKYGCVYDNKVRIVYFGNSDFQLIDSLTVDKLDELKLKLFGDLGDKLIVTCGYNGSVAQNHLEMINAIKRLDDTIRSKIHIVIPLTYGSTLEYNKIIKEALCTVGTSFTILDSFLETEEMASLRLSSDIVVNIQDTDALAASLQDHLYSGGVCIVGDWLNYIIYDKNNVFYIKTKKEELSHNIEYAITNFRVLKEKCVSNCNILKNLLSWDSTIYNWVNIYGE